MMSSKVNGSCVLTMRDGSERRISNRTILALHEDLCGAIRGHSGPLLDHVYQQFPILKDFRDATSVYSEDDDHLFELILNLVHGPAATPAEQPEGEGSAA